MIASGSTFRPRLERVIRDLFCLLHAVRLGTKTLIYDDCPREDVASTRLTIIFGRITSGGPWFLGSKATYAAPASVQDVEGISCHYNRNDVSVTYMCRSKLITENLGVIDLNIFKPSSASNRVVKARTCIYLKSRNYKCFTNSTILKSKFKFKYCFFVQFA